MTAKRRKRTRKPRRCTPPRRARSSSGTPYSYASKKRRKKPVCRKRSVRRTEPKRPPVRSSRPAPVQPVPPPPRPAPPAPPAPRPEPPPPVEVWPGGFGPRQAERLLWRAGFGPSPGHARALASMGLEAAVRSLTRPLGDATLTGAEPRTRNGSPLAPEDAWGHDHLWFLDRMVRTDQPLVERMTLIWHDWFATSNDGVGSQRQMLAQNALFRRHALGSFAQLAREVTADPAMILWLNLNENTRWSPNENYARELMELFTLGADRGAYTEQDVRELARALTGWRNDWSAELGTHNFRFDVRRADTGSKTVFGKTGAFGWEDAVRMCVEHPKHASYFVEKLWSYFIPVPPPEADRRALESLYVASGRQVRPVLESILVHPLLFEGPRMVKPPVVFAAGMLRALRRAVDIEDWAWICRGAGQQLFYPPNVSGWDERRWLDTSTMRGRWNIVTYGLHGRELRGAALDSYDAAETPAAALANARQFWGDPVLTGESETVLVDFARRCLPTVMASWQERQYRGLRQNALRQLLFASPDLQTS